MNVTLPPALDAFVKDMVASGRYADEADVVRDALRRLADQGVDLETGETIAALRESLAEAEAEANAASDATVMDIFERAAQRAVNP